MKTFIITAAIILSSMAHSSTPFDHCSCSYKGSSTRATGQLIGKNYVRNDNGSITIQALVLDEQFYSGENPWAMANDRVLDMCEETLKKFIKRKICPK